MRHVPLFGDWRLWQQFAVRSAGFPADGLDVLGPGDEAARLRAVACDARFRKRSSSGTRNGRATPRAHAAGSSRSGTAIGTCWLRVAQRARCPNLFGRRWVRPAERTDLVT